MRMKTLLFAACLPCTLFAQPSFIASLYPPQHDLNVPTDAELRVGLQAPLDPASLSDSSIYVWSDITGLHRLAVTLENGNRDLRIVPQHWRLNDRPAFNAGERVTVTLTTRLRYADGRLFEGFTWHYTMAVRQNHGGDFKVETLFGGGGSTYFFVSDFDGDGWPDLVGNDDGVQRKMIVFSNDGKGVLQFNHIENIIGCSCGETVDIDRDGDQEMTYGGDYLIFNDGNADFSLAHYPERPSGFAKSYDFNNDGIMDFAIGSVTSETIYFGLSVNGESFKKLQKAITPIPRPTFYRHGLSYDLNNDGRIDFLCVAGTGSGVIHGFESFEMTASDSLKLLQIKELFYEQGSFYGNDFDGDESIDYVFVPGGVDNYITFFNDGAGQLNPFRLKRDPNDSRLAEAVEGGDFDGDGDIDLAFASTNTISVMPERFAPDVSIYLNDGGGRFLLASRIPLLFDLPLSWILRAVDLDLDSDLDLIGVTGNGLFYVLANGDYPNDVADQESSLAPIRFSIAPIYPNPAKDSATIDLNLSGEINKEVIVTIFDVTGKLIHRWQFDGRNQAIRFTWDARDQILKLVPNGVYLINVQIGTFRSTRKLLVLR